MINKEEVKEMAQEIIDTHDMIIEATGGEKGVRDMGGLEHAVYEISSELDKRIVSILKNEDHNYSIHVSARIYELFATRHYFFDGNKRTAHIVAKIFLLLEGYHFKTPYKDAVKFIMEIADKKKDIKEIEKWIESNSARLKISIEDYIKISKENIEEIREYAGNRL